MHSQAMRIILRQSTYPVSKAPNPRLCADSSTNVVVIAGVDKDVEAEVAVDKVVVVRGHGFQSIGLLISNKRDSTHETKTIVGSCRYVYILRYSY